MYAISLAYLIILQAMLLSLMSLGSLHAAPSAVRIGVILDSPSEKEDDIILLATEQINTDAIILPNTLLVTSLKIINKDDTFAAVQKVCSFAAANYSAIVSSTSCDTSKVIQSVCEELNIPHIAVPRDNCEIRRNNGFSLSIRPNYIHIDHVVLGVIRRLGWKEAIIFYDSETAYRNVKNLLGLATAGDSTLEVILLKLDWNQTENNFNVKKPLHIAKTSTIHNYIVYCQKNNNYALLDQASAFGMTQTDHHWIVTTQSDLSRVRESYISRNHTVQTPLQQEISDNEMKHFNQSTGIIALIRQEVIINYTSRHFLEAWRRIYPNYTHNALSSSYNISTTVTTPYALSPAFKPLELNLNAGYLYDAIRITAITINDMIQRGRWTDPISVTCYNSERSRSWQYGKKFKNALYRVDSQGLLGRIHFNGTTYNDNINLEIVSLESELNKTYSWKIGQWDPVNKLNLTHMPFMRGAGSQLGNKSYKIVTIIEAPFVMIEETVTGVKYSGYCIDMLNEIAKELDFKYTLYLTPDDKYGGTNDDGTWNGLIGQVYYGKADLAVAGMIINSDREKVVDFTKPYMSYGVGILIRKPSKRTNVFAFLEPLNIWVWGCILAAFFIVGVLLYVLDRLSPYSNHNVKITEEPAQSEEFDLKNSLWFTFASFMQQAAPWKTNGPSQEGGDTTPISLSGRILSAFWWFFALIVIATYTANLAAFLTVTRMVNPIQSLEDLAYQTKVIYGTIEDSSLQTFFKKRSTVGIYERMWNYMTHVNPSPWVPNADAGYRRVKEESYAFFWDAPILEYIKQTECDVMTVGKPFNLKGYGIAAPIGAEYRDQISLSILRMQETGKLEELKKKWFERESICPEDDNTGSRDTSDIGLETVAGVFYILMMGAALSFITVVVEHIWHRPSVYKKKCKAIKTKGIYISANSNADSQAFSEQKFTDGRWTEGRMLYDPYSPSALGVTEMSTETSV